MSNGTSAPIQWQSEMVWIGPTYAGGQYYYIYFPGPDANNPSYQAVKQTPSDPSGLPAPPDMPYGPWTPLTLASEAIQSTLRWRFILNGAAWQLDGQISYGPGIIAGSAIGLAVLPAQLINGMQLPQNSIVMTNVGSINGAYAQLEIQAANPLGGLQITPRVSTMYSATIQGIYAYTTPAPVSGVTQLGSFPTLVAAMAACQNDVNPPIPVGLHTPLGHYA